jgi:hypothetical protein
MFIFVPLATIIDSPCPRALVGKENAELKETYRLIGGHSAVRAAAYRGWKTEVIQTPSQAEPSARKLGGDDASFRGLDELPL